MKTLREKYYELLEDVRHTMSPILMHTSEEHPIKCNVLLDAFMLSTLQSLTIEEVFEDKEGIIWVKMSDVEGYMELDDLDIKDAILLAESLNENFNHTNA